MANYVDQINLNGVNADIKGCDYYEGCNLAEKFADEIAGYSDVWAWIKARIHAKNYSKIHVGDYIPLEAGGLNYNATIMGINTYKGMGSIQTYDHIDFTLGRWMKSAVRISYGRYIGFAPTYSFTGDGSKVAFILADAIVEIAKVTVGGTVTKEYTYDASTKTVTFNSAPAADAAIVVTAKGSEYPWLVSPGYAFCNSLKINTPGYQLKADGSAAVEVVDYTEGGVYYYLPDELKAVIAEKLAYIPKRFSSGDTLPTENTGAGWTNIGKIWIPTEMEMLGQYRGSNKYESRADVQYPLFIGQAKWRAPRTTSFSGQWVLTPSDTEGSFDFFANDGALSSSTTNHASNSKAITPCFRISQW